MIDVSPGNGTHPKTRRIGPWPSMPDPAIILPAQAEEVYPLMMARTTNRDVIRRRIDIFCRAISDRAFATKYRQALLTVHRTAPKRELPTCSPQRGLSVGAPTPDELMRMSAACPADHAGLRDRALLLLWAVSGLRPAALVAIDVEHIRFSAAGLTLETGRGPLSVPFDAAPSLCPVQALRDWLHTSDIQSGPVFRRIGRWGDFEHRSRLAPQALRRVVLRRNQGAETLLLRQHNALAGPAYAAPNFGFSTPVSNSPPETHAGLPAMALVAILARAAERGAFAHEFCEA